MRKQITRKSGTTQKHTAAGKRLISAMKQVAAHARGEISLPIRYLEIPEDLDVRAIRKKLGLSQADFARRFAVSQRSLQEWEQGRRKPEGAVRAYLTVIKRSPETVAAALSSR